MKKFSICKKLLNLMARIFKRFMRNVVCIKSTVSWGAWVFELISGMSTYFCKVKRKARLIIKALGKFRVLAKIITQLHVHISNNITLANLSQFGRDF